MKSLTKEEYNFVDKLIIAKKARISELVITEILAYHKYSNEEAEVVEHFLYDNFVVEKVSRAVFVLAGEKIREARIMTNKKLKATDAIIAAQAIISKETLYTKDLEDFKNIYDLNLYTRTL